MAIGIASGTFVAGTIGCEERQEFTCIGDVVNTASRLKSVAAHYEDGVVVTEAVFRHIDALYAHAFYDIGDIALKGKSKVVRAYRVSTPLFVRLLKTYT